jgi:hypothetical protein
MSLAELAVPEDRTRLMDRFFLPSWSITEGRETVEVRAWLKGSHVMVVLSGSREHVYGVLWGLMQSLERVGA